MLTSDRSISRDTRSRVEAAPVRGWRTAVTASSVNPPWNTDRVASSSCSSSDSSRKLQSSVALRVWCRSAALLSCPASTSSCRSRASAISSRESTRKRADASSMASGRPSSWRQIRATSGALSSVSSKPGSAVLARSHHSWVAGDAATSAKVGVRPSGSTPRGCTGQTRSPGTPSGSRVVTSTRNPRQPSNNWCTASCAGTGQVLAVVEDQQSDAGTDLRDRRFQQRAVSELASADRRRDQPGDTVRVGDRRQVDPPDTGGVRRANEVDHGEGEPSLSRSARPGQRGQPASGQ